MCLTPRVSSFDMPTEFDRIWDIEKQQVKKDFNQQNISITNYELFCYMENLKTNRDVMNLAMEDLDELVERDDYNEISYLNNTKILKEAYEEYDKKNKLDIPINVVDDHSIIIHFLLSSAMKLRGFSVDGEDEKCKKLMKEYAESKFGKFENEYKIKATNINLINTEKPNKKKKKNKKK
jgi:hypothetical protein